MRKWNLLKNLIVCCCIFFLIPIAHASRPVWGFTALTPTKLLLTQNQSGVVEYRVTNHSPKQHTLVMMRIPGVTQVTTGAGVCNSVFTLMGWQSCILRLNVAGNRIPPAVIGGPIVCQSNSRLFCYQPGLIERLNIVAIPTPSVQYTITPTAGPNGSISPSTAQKVNSGGSLVFTATPNMGYGVNQWSVDGSVVQTGGSTYQLTNITANHIVSVTFGTATLTPSVSSLALSVNCQPASACTTTQNPALTGNPRQVTIQNTGSIPATNVTVSAPSLPSGTSITSNTCTGTLNAGSSCTFMLTPGAVASSNASNVACTSGTTPVSSTVTVSADGGLSSQIAALVLSYGCQYQGGFIYAVDDTTPNTGNIGGKVLSLVDQAAPYIMAGPQPTSLVWSSNGAGSDSANVSNDIIPGIDELSTSSVGSPTYASFTSFFASFYTNPNPFTPASFLACDGAIDGVCNVTNLFIYYNQLITNYIESGTPPFTASPGPTNTGYYAAGKCLGTINGYSDWYLPAICEMDAVDIAVVCPADFQNIITSLNFLVGLNNAPTPSTSCSPPSGTECLAGTYWTSTLVSGSPQNNAFSEYFSVGSSGQLGTTKHQENGVRCSRAITI